jgi:hypothetical protein
MSCELNRTHSSLTPVKACTAPPERLSGLSNDRKDLHSGAYIMKGPNRQPSNGKRKYALQNDNYSGVSQPDLAASRSSTLATCGGPSFRASMECREWPASWCMMKTGPAESLMHMTWA